MLIRAIRPGAGDVLAPGEWRHRLTASGWRLLDPPAWAKGVKLDGPEDLGTVEARVAETRRAAKAGQVAAAPRRKRRTAKRRTKKG